MYSSDGITSLRDTILDHIKSSQRRRQPYFIRLIRPYLKLTRGERRRRSSSPVGGLRVAHERMHVARFGYSRCHGPATVDTKLRGRSSLWRRCVYVLLDGGAVDPRSSRTLGERARRGQSVQGRSCASGELTRGRPARMTTYTEEREPSA